MKSRDERRADFERREAERKAKYRERMNAIKAKSAAQKTARIDAAEARRVGPSAPGPGSVVAGGEPNTPPAHPRFDSEGRQLPAMERGEAFRQLLRAMDPLKDEKARIAAMTSQERRAYIEDSRHSTYGGGGM